MNIGMMYSYKIENETMGEIVNLSPVNDDKEEITDPPKSDIDLRCNSPNLLETDVDMLPGHAPKDMVLAMRRQSQYLPLRSFSTPLSSGKLSLEKLVKLDSLPRQHTHDTGKQHNIRISQHINANIYQSFNSTDEIGNNWLSGVQAPMHSQTHYFTNSQTIPIIEKPENVNNIFLHQLILIHQQMSTKQQLLEAGQQELHTMHRQLMEMQQQITNKEREVQISQLEMNYMQEHMEAIEQQLQIRNLSIQYNNPNESYMPQAWRSAQQASVMGERSVLSEVIADAMSVNQGGSCDRTTELSQSLMSYNKGEDSRLGRHQRGVNFDGINDFTDCDSNTIQSYHQYPTEDAYLTPYPVASSSVSDSQQYKNYYHINEEKGSNSNNSSQVNFVSGDNDLLKYPTQVDKSVLRECGICNKTFKHACHLTQHYNSVHNCESKAYRCSVCGKRFGSQEECDLHCKKHSSVEKPYKCPQCPKQFIHKSDLRRHLCVHGQLPFTCPTCRKGFARKDHMEKHNESNVCRRGRPRHTQLNVS